MGRHSTGRWSSGPDNLADLVSRAAARRGQRPAFVDAHQRMTWAEFDACVSARAAALRGLGLRPGERLALLLPNSVAFPLTYFAGLRAGLVVVPVHTGCTPRELRYILTDSGAAAAVVDTDAVGIAGTAASGAEPGANLPELRHVLSARDIPVHTEPGPDPPPVRGGEDLAVLCYTSGTSGTPKGAMLSHRALLANLHQLAAIRPPPVRESDVVLLVLPLSHIYGLNVGLGMQTWAGATGLLVDRFAADGCLQVMAAEGVSVLVGAPPMYAAWSRLGADRLRAGFAGVRMALSGAAALPGGALAVIRDGAGVEVFEGYGLTETAPVLTSTLVGGRAKADSIGRPLPGVELALWDSGGEPLDPDEDEGTGQIVVRGANLFSGYWPDGHGGPDADGWLATGDIGFFDDEGDLHLVDRLADVVIVNGFTVYPQEVEAVLRTHPGVREAAVVGGPDPLTGESPRALVVPAGTTQPTEAELIEHCRSALARFKCPTTVSVVEFLPHSTTGKVSRARLRELGLA